MPLYFAHPAALLLLLVVPVLYAVYRYGDARRRAALARWTAAAAPRGAIVKRAMPAAAIAFLALALADPVLGPQQPGITAAGSADIVFLLDVSRSMLAADVAPNRLARAKAVIQQIALNDRGNRVALVAFAGGQSVACPLTVDHSFFAEALAGASPDSVLRGGTRIGDAIRFALERVFDDEQRDRRTIVVVSDGEDHESDPAGAAADAERAKVRLVSLGVAELEGAIVPSAAGDRTPFLYRGAPVVSRLDAGTLRTIARGGTFVSASDSIDAGDIYRRWLAPAGQGKAAVEPRGTAWVTFLSLALVLLAVEPRIRARQKTAALLAMVLVLRPFGVSAQTVDEWFGRGLDAMDHKQYVDAMRYFADAARWAPEIAEIRFNLGKSLYEFHSYAEASLAFQRAAVLAKDAHLRAQARLGEGNALYREATQRSNDFSHSIGFLRGSIEAYDAALKSEPGIFPAAINKSVAERRLRDLLRRNLDPPPSRPSEAPPSRSNLRPEERPEDILRQNRPAPRPPALAKPGGVEKDW